MKDYGAKIAERRAARKMTQAELGAMLNVTSQAVSKWENGLSEPDMDSIRKLCEIFEITFDEFFGVETKPDEKTEPTATSAVVLAYCDICDKPLYNPKEYQVTIVDGVQHTTCLDCLRQKEELSRQMHEQQMAQQRKQMHQDEVDKFKKGLLWGILGAVVLGGLLLIGGLESAEDPLATVIAMSAMGLYGGYAMISQFIWGNSVWRVFTFFLRSFKLPGVIFALSIDGLIFLIVVKLLGAVLRAIISVLLFFVGFFVTWFYAMIAFPFGLIRQIRFIKQIY